jgi:hypothetical protein
LTGKRGKLPKRTPKRKGDPVINRALAELEAVDRALAAVAV